MSLSHRRRGFTLLEVLVAISVSAVILSVSYGAFFAIEKSTKEAGGYSSRLLEARRFLDGFQREIRSCSLDKINILNKNVYGQDFSYIYIQSFVTGFPALADIVYLIKESSNGFQVYKTVSIAGVGQGAAVMLENVKRFNLKKLDKGLIEADLVLGQAKGVDIKLSAIIEPMKGLTL